MALKPPETAPKPPPETAPRAVLFTAGVEIQGFGQVQSANPARMPGCRLELGVHGVTVTTFSGVTTLVPWHMVKAVHL